MLMIRLQPRGKKGQRSYRLIVNEKHKDVFGDYLEQVGTYDPNPTPAKVELKKERITHWLSNGAQPSATVQNLLIDAGLLQRTKLRKGNTQRGKPAEKPAEAPAAKPAEPAAAKPEEKPKVEPTAEAKKEA